MSLRTLVGGGGVNGDVTVRVSEKLLTCKCDGCVVRRDWLRSFTAGAIEQLAIGPDDASGCEAAAYVAEVIAGAEPSP